MEEKKTQTHRGEAQTGTGVMGPQAQEAINHQTGRGRDPPVGSLEGMVLVTP